MTAENWIKQLQLDHMRCVWKQVGPCVYCADHGTRLYQGQLPADRRTILECAPGEHDWDPDMGLGFYIICRTCGHHEWCD